MVGIKVPQLVGTIERLVEVVAVVPVGHCFPNHPLENTVSIPISVAITG